MKSVNRVLLICAGLQLVMGALLLGATQYNPYLPKSFDQLQASQVKPKIPDPQKKKTPYPRGRGRIQAPKHILEARVAWSKARNGHHLKMLRKATPATYDCRTLGQDTAIQDQGQCGDCYAFSGTEVCACAQLTASIVSLQKTPAFQLSVQWTLDCHTELGGCNGGDEWQVAQLIMQGGAPSLADYPGAGQNPGTCNSSVALNYKILNMGYCDPNAAAGAVGDTQLIKNALVQYGPISVAVAAGSWSDPGSTPITGNDTSVDHAIMIVGWDDTKGSKGCWIIKNSWGTDWGMGGYAYIEYGADSVGTEAFWVTAGTPSPVPPTPVPPLPPLPPTPPTPPGPPPAGNVTITLSGAVAGTLTGTVTIQPTPGSVVVTPTMTLAEFATALEKCRVPTSKEPPLAPKK
jgi:Papain family cysteine protease